MVKVCRLYGTYIHVSNPIGFSIPFTVSHVKQDYTNSERFQLNHAVMT